MIKYPATDMLCRTCFYIIWKLFVTVSTAAVLLYVLAKGTQDSHLSTSLLAFVIYFVVIGISHWM